MYGIGSKYHNARFCLLDAARLLNLSGQDSRGVFLGVCGGVWGERLWMRASIPVEAEKNFKYMKEKLLRKRKGKRDGKQGG